MCVEGLPGRKVDPKKYAQVFAASEQWPEVAKWAKYDWKIVRNVPIEDLEHTTIDVYDLEAEQDPDEEKQEDVNRVLEVMCLLKAGEDLWPVVMGLDCMVLDGYHRMAAAEELGIQKIDVIYPVSRT